VKRRVSVLSAASFALSASLSGSAWAYPKFPEVIQNHFDAKNEHCPVTCLLCHRSTAGGDETIRASGFVSNLIFVSKEGGHQIATREDEPSDQELVAALETLKTEPCERNGTELCDADGDGMTDYDELAAGRDPDQRGEGVNECPRYGCGAHIAPTPARSNGPGFAAMAALGVALLLVRRRAQSARL